jgi:NAD(P)-dependent dehydrogenase (short-subunit alcohol dehydrogenase family)
VLHGGSSPERLDAALRALKARGAAAVGFLERADSPGAASRILVLASECAGGGAGAWRPDILVCGWGPFLQKPLGALSEADWARMAWANLALPGALVSLCIDRMLEKGWGRILLFGGTNTAGVRGFRTTAAYAAAKTGLGVLVKSAALAGAGRGLTCNALCPGLVDTEYCSPRQRRYNREKSPAGGPLRPRDIARAALAVLETPAINGAIIPVDRGVVL